MPPCAWRGIGEEARRYHDERWCKPLHDDQELFAMLMLEAMSVGLSWNLILKREDAMRAACDGFDPSICARYDDEKMASLMQAPGLIHNAGKIEAIRRNARAFLDIQAEFGSFDAYIWSFSEGRTIDHRLSTEDALPARSELSERLSRDLKKRGMSFLGPVICYSFLQAIGVYNDHDMGCPYR